MLNTIKEKINSRNFTIEVYSENDGSTAVDYVNYIAPSTEFFEVKEYENKRHIIKGKCTKEDYKNLIIHEDVKFL